MVVYSSIAWAIGVSTTLMVGLIGLLMYESAWLVLPVVGFMAALGIALGIIALKAH